METTIKVPFGREIQNFLISQHYTHVFNKGHETEDSEDNDYYIIPLKKEDLDLQDENHLKIDSIDSDDVCDMADGVEFINFIIEVPTIEYEKFLEMD